MSDNTLLDAALAYASRGWSIIPIRHKPGTDGKQPVMSWKAYQTRRSNKSELQNWFGNGRAVDGLAVILGKVSGGLVCRDFDTMESYQRWVMAYPDQARKLPTVVTARGRHVYFRSAWSGYVDLGDGELRGDSGHYCLLPPSTHPSGTAYRWAVPWPKEDFAPADPRELGFLPETERTECAEKQRDRETERTEETDEAEKTSNNGASDHCSTLSALSVLSVSQSDAPKINDAIEAAIRSTLPSAIGQRNRVVFELARAIKAIPGLSDAPVHNLRDIVRTWHSRALPIIGTKPFDDTWADFCTAWPAVKFPKGQEPMALIMERVSSEPLPQVAERYDAPETQRLIAVCRELQRVCGDGPFFLSCRMAAEHTGLDHPTAWRRLRMLETDGVLRSVQRGDRHRATRYRYVADEAGTVGGSGPAADSQKET